MTHKQRHLSINETVALDIIQKHPGLTPQELAPLLPEDISDSSASAITSRLTYLHKVNRLKVKGASSFRYYPADAALPKGHAEWNNALVKVKRWKDKKGNGNGNGNGHGTGFTKDLEPPQQTLDLQPPAAAPAPPAAAVEAPPAVTSQHRGRKVLFTFQIAEREALTLDYDQAREFYEMLHAVFGR